MQGKRYGHSEDLDAYLARTVYPALFDCLDNAFPEFGWERRGGHWTATRWPADFPYPVGNETPERLMVYPDRPYWVKVHGHEGVRFLALVNGGQSPKGPDFIPAVRKLCDKAGVRFPERSLTPEQAEAARKHEARRSVLDTVMDYARERLRASTAAGKAARAYLHGRGFTDEDIASLGLGLYESASAAREAVLKAGHEEKEAEDAAVLWKKLEGYILIPWADDHGRPLTIYGRWKDKTPPEGTPKTIALPGEGTKRSPLYFDRARAAHQKDLVLVEGVFDAALLQVKGDTRAVASVAAQLNENQVETLRRNHVRSVFICGDPDGGGDRGTLANVAALEKAGIKAYVVPRLPDGKDPDEFVQANGIDAWKDLVLRSEHSSAFRAREIADRHKAGGEAVWTDRSFDEALSFDDRTTDARARVDLDKYFWPAMRTALDLPEETVRACLEDRRREADRTREQKALEEEARAHDNLLEEYRGNLAEMGPEGALRRLHDEIDRLRRGGLRLKAEEVLHVAEELQGHAEYLETFMGKQFIGLRQRTLSTLDEATLGLRGLMLLAAEPNAGKTVLAVQLGTDIVVHNPDACFVFLSLEMTRYEILTRIKSRLAGIHWNKLVFGESFTAEEYGNLQTAERKLRELGDRIVILDGKNFPQATVEKLVREVRAVKERSNATRAFVLVDYLQVFPIPEHEAKFHRTDLDADKWRIGAMKDLRDYLEGDAVMVISEARKPSKDDPWAGNLAAVMGAARGTYTPDMVFLLTPFTDAEIQTTFSLPDKDASVQNKRKALEDEEGRSLVKLTIAKGRDGVKRGKEIPLSFWFMKSDMEEDDSSNGNNVYQSGKVNKGGKVKR